jgi:hypothetical protein
MSLSDCPAQAHTDRRGPIGHSFGKSKMGKSGRKKALVNSDNKQICFVIMPFGGWLDDYYQSVYCPAITAAGLEPHRADDLFRPSTIVNDIWSYTKRASVLLADLSGKNPNVFYELGLAHALAKPAILIAEAMEDIPFDLRALRIIIYDKNAHNWGQLLREKIGKSLTEVLAAPAEAVLPAFLDVKSAGAKPSVSAEKKDIIEIKQEIDLLRRQLRAEEPYREIFDRLSQQAATNLVRHMVSSGDADSNIVESLSRRGVPTSWTYAAIREMRDNLLDNKLANE